MTELRKEDYGPTGDPSRHLPLDMLHAGLAASPAPPRDVGSIVLLVQRHPDGTRSTHDEAHLSVDGGLVGDGWARRPPRDVLAQITVMRRHVAEVIANGQALTMFGDNVLVDMDLSERTCLRGHDCGWATRWSR